MDVMRRLKSPPSDIYDFVSRAGVALIPDRFERGDPVSAALNYAGAVPLAAGLGRQRDGGGRHPRAAHRRAGR